MSAILHVNEISSLFERTGAKTRFEKKARGNSEMAYSKGKQSTHTIFLCSFLWRELK